MVLRTQKIIWISTKNGYFIVMLMSPAARAHNFRRFRLINSLGYPIYIYIYTYTYTYTYIYIYIYIYIYMHGWRMSYGRCDCGRCHTNFARATPTFCRFIIIGHTNFDLLVNHIMFWPHQLWKPSSAHVYMRTCNSILVPTITSAQACMYICSYTTFEQKKNAIEPAFDILKYRFTVPFSFIHVVVLFLRLPISTPCLRHLLCRGKSSPWKSLLSRAFGSSHYISQVCWEHTIRGNVGWNYCKWLAVDSYISDDGGDILHRAHRAANVHRCQRRIRALKRKSNDKI